MDGGETIEDLSSLCARCGDIVGATNALPLFASRLHSHRKCLTLLEHVVEVVGNNGVVSVTNFDGEVVSEENALLPSLFSFCQRVEITSMVASSSSSSQTRRERECRGSRDSFGDALISDDVDMMLSYLKERDASATATSTTTTPRARGPDSWVGRTPNTEERRRGVWGYVSNLFGGEDEGVIGGGEDGGAGGSEELDDVTPLPPRSNRSSRDFGAGARRKSIDDGTGLSDIESFEENASGEEAPSDRVQFNNLSLNSPHVNKGVKPDEVLSAAGLVYVMCNYWVHEHESNEARRDTHELNVVRATAVAVAFAKESDDGDVWKNLARSPRTDIMSCKLYDLLEGLLRKDLGCRVLVGDVL